MVRLVKNTYLVVVFFFFFFFLFSIFDNEPSEIWCYLREKKSKGRFFAFFVLFCFVLFFLLANNTSKEKGKEKLKDCIWEKFSSAGELVYVLYM